MCGRRDNLDLAPDVDQGYEFRAVSDPTQLYQIEKSFGIAENVAGAIDDGSAKSGGGFSLCKCILSGNGNFYCWDKLFANEYANF